MMIAQVRFGRTHAVTAVGDIWKGRQEIEIPCVGTIEISKANDSRYTLFENTGEHVACVDCRRITGLNRDEE